MKKERIFFTSSLPGVRFKDLVERKEFDIFFAEDKGTEVLRKNISDVDPSAIISLLSDRIDKMLIDSAPSLKIVSNYAVGYNNIDVEYCTEKGIFVTNTPGVLTDATADIAIMLMLMVSRRAIPSDRFTRDGLFKGWEPELFAGKSLQGKTIGIIGMGRIGRSVALRAKAFGMDIVYYNRNRLDPENEKELNAGYLSLEELLRKSDFISLHIPYTPEVHHLIGDKQMALMKKDVILINTARGQLVDEKCLVRYLKEKRIYGAGLDVYEREPDLEAGLKDLDNVVLLPHIGSATQETRSKMADMVINDAVSVLKGNSPVNPVNLI